MFLVVDESEINGSKYLNILIGDTAMPETIYVLDYSIVETVLRQIESLKYIIKEVYVDISALNLKDCVGIGHVHQKMYA